MLFLLVLLLLPLTIHADDLDELSANPALLVGSFGLFGLSDVFDSPARWRSGLQDRPIDQMNEIDQFRLSVLAGLDQHPFRRRECIQRGRLHESPRPRPPN